MPEYKWKGIDIYGKTHHGTLYANSHESLKNNLLQQNIALLSCKEKIIISWQFNKGSTSQIISFLHNLSILLNSDIPLALALLLSKQYIISNRFKRVVSRIEKDIKYGQTLSKAVSKHPNYFSNLVEYIIASGEKADSLQSAFEHLVTYLKQKQDVRKKLQKAALLPAITLIFSLLIIGILIIFVIPHLTPLLAAKKIPWTTKIILFISNSIQNKQSTIIGMLICLLGCIQILKKQPYTKAWWHKILLHIPFVKNISIFSNVIYFTQTLSLLLQNGTPLTTSIEMASKTCTNIVLQKQFLGIAKHIHNGKSFSAALKIIDSPYLPEAFITSIAIGEETEKMELMLNKCNALYKELLEQNIYLLTTIFQPVLLVITGLIIAFLMLSLYLPLFSIAY